MCKTQNKNKYFILIIQFLSWSNEGGLILFSGSLPSNKVRYHSVVSQNEIRPVFKNPPYISNS